jgi:hypothetical protein
VSEYYESDVVLGQKYLEPRTGIEGTAVAVAFYEYACERVTLEVVIRGKIEEYTFDAPRLVSVQTGEQATSEKTGGPRDMPTRTGLR